MEYSVRSADSGDANKIFALYKTVAKEVGGIAREEDEIKSEYVYGNLERSLNNGFCLVIENPKNKEELIAEIHCYHLEPRVFHHVLSELTIVVHPVFQHQGLGKLLFSTLLDRIEKGRKDVLRVELIVRESNLKAIDFYKNLGFKVEGRLENRIRNSSGYFEADIPMAWFNTHFEK